MDAKWIGCDAANWRAGRGGREPDSIVIHLMGGSLAGTDTWFATPPELRGPDGIASSAHYGIGRAGERHQYVREEDTAFHAGRVKSPTWRLLIPGVNPNAHTIGIEHEGHPEDVWSDEMCEASAWLIADICARWAIPIDRDHIVGHHEIYAVKLCPGEHCDIDWLIQMARAIPPPRPSVST